VDVVVALIIHDELVEGKFMEGFRLAVMTCSVGGRLVVPWLGALEHGVHAIDNCE
jgi:hypothetical protein